MSEYPDNWEQIAWRIKRQAGQRCEHCGHVHDVRSGHVLTVHHLDGNPANCAPENLVALCQRCHLHIQARFVVGQIVMEIFRPDWMRRRGIG